MSADGTIRLAGWPDLNNFGRLEVYFRNQWGTVCKDGWSNQASIVVCRQLGFKHGTLVYPDYRVVESTFSMPIWLDDVQCDGSETELQACRFPGYGLTNCGHYSDVYLECTDATPPSPPSPSPPSPSPRPPRPPRPPTQPFEGMSS